MKIHGVDVDNLPGDCIRLAEAYISINASDDGRIRISAEQSSVLLWFPVRSMLFVSEQNREFGITQYIIPGSQVYRMRLLENAENPGDLLF